MASYAWGINKLIYEIHMKKKLFYIFIGLLLAGIGFVCIIPMFGLPNSEQINGIRKERLRTWAKAVNIYNQHHEQPAKSLYEVFKYKTGYDLNLVILNMVGNESELIQKDKVLENKDVFEKKIDYELVWIENKWFIQERKIYPRFFHSLWKIDPNETVTDIAKIQNSSK